MKRSRADKILTVNEQSCNFNNLEIIESRKNVVNDSIIRKDEKDKNNSNKNSTKNKKLKKNRILKNSIKAIKTDKNNTLTISRKNNKKYDLKNMSQLELIKIKQLKTMRIISTSLLILMTFVYIVSKKFSSGNIVVSMITAFSEAAMVGALADWFAVVALFKHPLGMRWIPHTAIIRNQKDKIGETMSNFVVNNFFTEDAIRKKLENVNILHEVMGYLNRNKNKISIYLDDSLPKYIDKLIKNKEFNENFKNYIKQNMGRNEIYKFFGSFMQIIIDYGCHKSLLKELLDNLYNYLSNNKQQTLEYLEGISKKLSLPIIRDVVYRDVLKAINNQAKSLDLGTDSVINKLLDENLKDAVYKLRTGKIDETKKLDKVFDNYPSINEMLNVILSNINTIIQYNLGDTEALIEKIEGIIDVVCNNIAENKDKYEKLDEFIKNLVTRAVCLSKDEIGRLINDTVNDWSAEDVADKLEIQVGADLQYIRINGTIIGGLAGLLIFLISYLLRF